MALSTSLTKVTRVGLSSFQNYEINAVTAVGVATFSILKLVSVMFMILDSMLFQILEQVLQLDQLVMLHFLVLNCTKICVMVQD